MKTTTMMLILTLALAGCAARPKVTASPQVRCDAMKLILDGGTIRDVAAKMALRPDEAREMIRTTLVKLNHVYYRGE
jgi:hypothetical protein